jgi:hypothetical protein
MGYVHAVFRHWWFITIEIVLVAVDLIAPADGSLYRDIRLKGLRGNPEAFASTFESENARLLTFFSERIGRSAAFGAFHAGETRRHRRVVES